MVNEVLLSLQQKVLDAKNIKEKAKQDLKLARKELVAARRVKNEQLMSETKVKVEELLEKPISCKEELLEAKQYAKTVENKSEKAYAKQAVKDAKIRLKSAKKEVFEAKKMATYARFAGDTSAIVATQEKINDIKLEITKSHLMCDRIICDAKSFISSQQKKIEEVKDLVTVNDENAINCKEECLNNIQEAKNIIKEARKVLPFYHNAKKFYDNHLQTFEAILCLAPAGIILLVFMIFPLINTSIMSFMENFRFANKGGIFAWGHSFSAIGFGEYLSVLRDPVFLQALKNTTIMVVVSVPLTVIIALFISVALNGIKKLQGMYQTIFFLPYVTNTIALGMVFKVMFATKGGLINLLFNSNVPWLTDATAKGYWTSLVVLTVYTVWNGLAFKILIFLSGLQSIDKQYYDAALIDGASKNRIFRKITVPLLSPMILYTVITSFIGAFKSYSNVIAVFGRGPNIYGPAGNEKMWITVVGYIYDKMPAMMSKGALSRAAAGSVILLVIILLITIVQFAVSKKRVHY